MAKRDLDIPMPQQPDTIIRVPMMDRTGQQIRDASHRVGDQGSHFNVRPSENPRTGKVPGTAQHYEY